MRPPGRNISPTTNAAWELGPSTGSPEARSATGYRATSATRTNSCRSGMSPATRSSSTAFHARLPPGPWSDIWARPASCAETPATRSGRSAGVAILSNPAERPDAGGLAPPHRRGARSQRGAGQAHRRFRHRRLAWRPIQRGEAAEPRTARISRCRSLVDHRREPARSGDRRASLAVRSRAMANATVQEIRDGGREVWFSGAHSDVGGGYIVEESRDADTPYADDITLDRMIRRTKHFYPNFPFDIDRRAEKIKDRSSAVLHNSRRNVYLAWPFALRSIANHATGASRWKYQAEVSRDRHARPIGEIIHISAIERVLAGGPSNPARAKYKGEPAASNGPPQGSLRTQAKQRRRPRHGRRERLTPPRL